MPLDALSQRILSLKGVVRPNLAIPSVPKVGILYLDEPLTDTDIAIHNAKKALKNVYDGIKNRVHYDDMDLLVDNLYSAMEKLEEHELRRFRGRNSEDLERAVRGWMNNYLADGGSVAAREAQEAADATRARAASRAARAAEQRAAEAAAKRKADAEARQSQDEARKAAEAEAKARADAAEREREREAAEARARAAGAAEARRAAEAAEVAAKRAAEAVAREKQAAARARQAAQEAEARRARQQGMAAEARDRASREAREAAAVAAAAKARVEQQARDADLARKLHDDEMRAQKERVEKQKAEDAKNDEAIARELQREKDEIKKREEERERQIEREQLAAEAAAAEAAAAEKLAELLRDFAFAKKLQEEIDEESAREFARTQAESDAQKRSREEAEKQREAEERRLEASRRKAEEDKRNADMASNIERRRKEWYEGKWIDSYQMIDVPGDGNCFFHAIVRSGNLSVTHTELRQGLVDFMRANPTMPIGGINAFGVRMPGDNIYNLIEQGMREPVNQDLAKKHGNDYFNHYLIHMSRNGIWATDVERIAIGLYLKRPVRTVWEVGKKRFYDIPEFDLPDDDDTILIYFHQGGHYSAMRKKRAR